MGSQHARMTWCPAQLPVVPTSPTLRFLTPEKRGRLKHSRVVLSVREEQTSFLGSPKACTLVWEWLVGFRCERLGQ